MICKRQDPSDAQGFRPYRAPPTVPTSEIIFYCPMCEDGSQDTWIHIRDIAHSVLPRWQRTFKYWGVVHNACTSGPEISDIAPIPERANQLKCWSLNPRQFRFWYCNYSSQHPVDHIIPSTLSGTC